MMMLFIASQSIAQKTDVSKMTRADILSMSYDELGAMPLEDVMKLTEILGVSLNELYEMLLNKDVVSASKKVESSFDSPLSSTVISYDEIIASGARNIQEALRLVPGVIVREKTNGNYDIHIRGNNNIPDDNLTVYTENSMTLVMIDNRPIYNYINGGTFWESLPVDFADIDRIEVVRGAVSALYGANAVTGVINIITKNPNAEEIQVYGQLQGGNLGSYMGNISIGQKVGKFGYRVSGNYQKMERVTDKLYVFQYDSLFNADDIQELPDKTSNWLKVFNPTEKISDWHPCPETAVDRFGVNANLYYNPTDDINFVLSGGYQDSYVNSSSFGDPSISLTGRDIKSSYFNAIGKIKGLTLQANMLFAEQDIVNKNVGFKADNSTLNLNAEYDFYLGKLNIRPGISYQRARYDDTPYLTPDSIGNYTSGYLNKECDFHSVAGSLRFDYKLLDDKFRFILGGRFEKFNTSDDIYFPFQFVVSYNVNQKHLLRAVASRANRSPFLVDTYSNFDWNRVGRPFPNHMVFNGNKEQKLAKTTMGEIGYRYRPVKNLSIDLEAFASITKDFGCLLPESMTAYVHTDSMSATVSVPDLGAIYTKNYFPAPAIPNTVIFKYQNIDVEAQQIGATLNLEWVATEKLLFKVFGTLQQTKLKNYVCYKNSTIITDMTTLAAIGASKGEGIVGQEIDDYFNMPFTASVTQQLENGGYDQIEAGLTQKITNKLIASGLSKEEAATTATQQAAALMSQKELTINGMMPSVIAEQKFDYDTYDNTLSAIYGEAYDGRYAKKTITHKATPAFFGGFSVNYMPIEKLNIYASGNFYSKQTYRTSNGVFETDPKFTMNCKVSYKVWKDNAVFVNARNIFDDKKQEFAWTDETKGCYLVGLDIKF